MRISILITDDNHNEKFALNKQFHANEVFFMNLAVWVLVIFLLGIVLFTG